MKCDILIAGVGGQGQVLASRLLGEAAIDEGLSVRTSETIGMSQRGGSVTSNVRIGGGVLSAAVPKGKADLLIGFEICEAVRNLGRLQADGCAVLSTKVISPVAVSLGISCYDSAKMLEFIRKNVKRLVIVDAPALAQRAGSVKAANVVMLGAAAGAGFLPYFKERLLWAVERNVPQKFKELNRRAFLSGCSCGERFAAGQ